MMAPISMPKPCARTINYIMDPVEKAFVASVFQRWPFSTRWNWKWYDAHRQIHLKHPTQTLLLSVAWPPNRLAFSRCLAASQKMEAGGDQAASCDAPAPLGCH